MGSPDILHVDWENCPPLPLFWRGDVPGELIVEAFMHEDLLGAMGLDLNHDGRIDCEKDQFTRHVGEDLSTTQIEKLCQPTQWQPYERSVLVRDLAALERCNVEHFRRSAPPTGNSFLSYPFLILGGIGILGMGLVLSCLGFPLEERYFPKAIRETAVVQGALRLSSGVDTSRGRRGFGMGAVAAIIAGLSLIVYSALALIESSEDSSTRSQ